MAKTSQSRNGEPIVAHATDFKFIEAFNTLAINLKYSVKGTNKVLFTSSSPAEGKTTVSVNTAIALANQGNRVLLVDCDMRKPKIKKFFKLDSKTGLAEGIVGLEKFDKIIQKSKIEGLEVVLAGNIPPSPARLLSSPEMKKFLDDVTPKYDWIIFDTPPVNMVPDAVVLVNHNVAVVVIADKRDATINDLTKSLDALKLADANIIGIVMNNVESKGLKYKYKYRYKYSYYSGSDDND